MAVEPMTPPAGDKPPKRGPGRPKGSKNKPKSPLDQFESQSAGNGDSPPKRRPGRPKGSRSKKAQAKVTEQIEDALAEILTAPAMPCAFMGDEWGAKHFTTTGRELATRLAQFSERNDQFRRWCETLMDTESYMMLVLASAAYAVPPLLHWNILPGAEKLGVPKSQRRRKQTPSESASGATEWPDRHEAPRPEQEYEDAMRSIYEDGEAEPFGAEFSDDEELHPPTFVETPVS